MTRSPCASARLGMTTGQIGRPSRVGDRRGRMLTPESLPCGATAATSSYEGTRAVKFRVDRDVLADAVAWAARSLPVRPSVPVLSGLLIEASDDGLVLSTFDYETSARATLSADVSDEGKALVSGRLLSDICRSLPGQAGRDDARRARGSALTCGSARFSLQTMPVEDYPALPDMPAATGTVSQRRVRARRRPGGHRRRPRRHAAGAHRRPDRDLDGVDDLDAGHRPVPALPPRARAGTPQPRRVRWPRSSRRRCSATPPSR